MCRQPSCHDINCQSGPRRARAAFSAAVRVAPAGRPPRRLPPCRSRRNDASETAVPRSSRVSASHRIQILARPSKFLPGGDIRFGQFPDHERFEPEKPPFPELCRRQDPTQLLPLVRINTRVRAAQDDLSRISCGFHPAAQDGWVTLGVFGHLSDKVREHRPLLGGEWERFRSPRRRRRLFRGHEPNDAFARNLRGLPRTRDGAACGHWTPIAAATSTQVRSVSPSSRLK